MEVFLRAADVIGNELLPLKPLEGTGIGDCYATYLDILDRYKLLTFGMIIAKAVDMLGGDPQIYERVAGTNTRSWANIGTLIPPKKSWSRF